MDLCQLYSSNSWDLLQFFVLMILSRALKKKVPPIWHSWVISIASYSWEFRGVFFKAWPLFSLTYCWFSWISNLAWMLFAAHNFSQAVTSILDLCCGSGVQGIVALRHYASNASFVVGKHGASVSQCRHISSPGIQVDWKMIHPEQWGFDLLVYQNWIVLELNGTGNLLEQVSAKGCSNSTRRPWYCFGGVNFLNATFVSLNEPYSLDSESHIQIPIRSDAFTWNPNV